MSSFDEIQSLAKTGYWELDLLNNRLHWSDEIYRIFECSPQEFEATYEAFLSFIHPDDLYYVNESYTTHIATQNPYDIIHRILLKNGKVKYVNERCKSDFDLSGKPIRSLGTIVDITERIQIEYELKLANEKARESEQSIKDITSNFETFFNTIDDFLFVIDDKGDIIHCNKTVEKRLGYSLEELKGKSILTVHPEERRGETAQILSDVVGGKVDSFQIPLVTKQQKQIHVETHANSGMWNGKPAMFGVSKDITKLKLSEEKFSTVFYINPSACSLSDINTCRFIEVNDAFCELSGDSREETLGHTAAELQIMPEQTRTEILSRADSMGRISNFEAELFCVRFCLPAQRCFESARVCVLIDPLYQIGLRVIFQRLNTQLDDFIGADFVVVINLQPGDLFLLILFLRETVADPFNVTGIVDVSHQIDGAVIGCGGVAGHGVVERRYFLQQFIHGCQTLVCGHVRADLIWQEHAPFDRVNQQISGRG